MHLLELQAKELGVAKEELGTIYMTRAIEKERLIQIRNLKGKYRDSLSSTEDFMKQKQEEIKIEDKRSN